MKRERPRYPKRIESQYVSLIKKIFFGLIQRAKDFQKLTRVDSDLLFSEVELFKQGLKLWIEQYLSADTLERLIRPIAEKMSAQNYRTHLKSLDIEASPKSFLLRVNDYSPALQNAIQDFTRENISLINSVATEYIDKVEKIVLNGIRSGTRVEEIANSIKMSSNISMNRAKFIARDQIGKFNGSLSKTRQTSLGIKKYTWRTSRNERVRGNPSGLYPDAHPSHFAREGKVFEWDKPPEGGHPGMDYGCQCVAEGVIDDFII